MILITGGSGFVGKHFVKSLINHDYDIKGIKILDYFKGELPEGVKFVEGEVTHIEDVKNYMENIIFIVETENSISTAKIK